VTNISLYIDLVPAVLAFAVATSIALVLIPKKGLDHRRLWAAGTFAFSLGMLLLVARGQIPDFLSILMANLLIIAGYATFTAGTRLLVGRSVTYPVAIGAIAGAAFAAAYALGASVEVRIVIISVLSIIQSVFVVHAFVRPQRHWTTTLIAAVFALDALLASLRLLGVLEVISPPGGVGLLHALILNFGVAVSLGVSVMLIVISLSRPRLAMANELPSLEAAPASPEPQGVSAQAEPPAIPARTEMEAGWRLLHRRSVLLSPDGAEVRLTGNEYLLLREFGDQTKPVGRAALNAAIGRSADNPKDRSIDFLISRLKRKCSDAGLDLPMSAVRGTGYVFRAPLRLAED